MPASLFNKAAGRKRTPVQVHSYKFCVFFRNDYLVEHGENFSSKPLRRKLLFFLHMIPLEMLCHGLSNALIYAP